MATPSVPVRTPELIGVAARLFRDRGYDATTMQNIADELGIRKGSIYHYVETKEDLLWMIVEAPLTELTGTVQEILADEGLTYMERIHRAVLAHAVSFETHYPHMFVITRENGETLSRKRQAALQNLRDGYYDLWKAAVTAGIESGEFRRDLHPSVTVEAIFGMLSWMFRWFSPEGRLTATDVAEQFSAILTAGIPAPRSASA